MTKSMNPAIGPTINRQLYRHWLTNTSASPQTQHALNVMWTRFVVGYKAHPSPPTF